MDFQLKSARFLENHDEPRAAAAFAPGIHQAAAVLTYLCPGLRFFHQGQMEGYTKRVSVHLGRGPAEQPSQDVRQFYDRLLCVLRLPASHEGNWSLLECTPAWDGNWTSDCFISFAWQAPRHTSLIVIVNYAANQSQCRLRVPVHEFAGEHVRLRDLMGPAVYDRDSEEILAPGLYLDLPAWGYHVFEVTTRAEGRADAIETERSQGEYQWPR